MTGLRQKQAALHEWSDQDLAEVAQENLDAFGELVRRHQDFVFGAALRVVRNRVVAEDIAQETFLRAHRSLDTFRGDSKVRSWLYRIATNLALNAVSRKKEFPTDVLPESAAAGGPAAAAETAEMTRQMRTAIEGLPETLRRPLVLREYHDMSYDEIAEATGLPINTVRTRILRARRALGKQMETWR